MVLRLYGLENLQSYIRNHIDLAKCFEDLVAQDSRFEVINCIPSEVCCLTTIFHYKLNAAILWTFTLLIIHHNWQIVTPRIFSLVCFRLLPPHNDETYATKLNHDLLDTVNSTGKIFVSHTVSSLFGIVDTFFLL